MNALPSNVVDFKLPKKPKVREKEEPPKRKICVVPMRAITDRKLTEGSIRVLLAICSYANRAGITWVSQVRLAKDLSVSQQAVSRQLVKLKELGYVEVVRKGFRGERTDTVRVVYDPDIDVETAIAVTSSIEDTRPPVMIEKQLKAEHKPREDDFTEEQLAANRERIRQMLGGMAPTNRKIHEPQRLKLGDLPMPKPKAKPTVHKQPPEVVHEPTVHIQPDTQHPEVVLKHQRTLTGNLKKIIDKELKINFKTVRLLEVMNNLQLTDDELTMVCRQLSERYQAEGLAVPTNEEQLADDLVMLYSQTI